MTIAAALALTALDMAEPSPIRACEPQKPPGECTGTFTQFLEEEPLWGYSGANRINDRAEFFYHRLIQYESCRAAALDSPSPCMELPDRVDDTAEISPGDTPRAKCLFAYAYLSKKPFEPTCRECMTMETEDLPLDKKQICSTIADPAKACDRLAERVKAHGINFSSRIMRQCRAEFPTAPDDCYTRNRTGCLSKIRVWNAMRTGKCDDLKDNDRALFKARETGEESNCELIMKRTLPRYCQWRESGFDQRPWRAIRHVRSQDGTSHARKFRFKPPANWPGFRYSRRPRNVWQAVYGNSRRHSARMKLIPEGEFLLGNQSPDEVYDNNYPQAKIHLPAFWMDRTHVTVEDFRDYSERTGVPMPAQPDGSTPSHPVVNVTWSEAMSFCLNRGKALPTEAQWERAARGGTETQFSYGNEEKQGLEYSWRNDNSEGHAHPVAQKKPNQFGLYDMHGNAWHWVADWYDKDYYQQAPAKNPQGPETGTHKVLRGGAYNTYPYNTRSAFRDHLPPGDRDESHGFRCVKPAR